jgi:hypothetical protein|tara:strand:- start:58 stop:546 length:489 start_codon:yes stop_codon:yes gene_type:complete
MKNIGYKITGISLVVFIVGLILSTIGNGADRAFKLIYLCNFFNYCPASLGSGTIGILLFLDYVITLLIFGVFLIQGIYYFRMNEERKTKLLNWSAGLSLTALIISILTFLFLWIGCLPQGGIQSECFAWSWILGVFPVGFAGILYLTSLVLLLINWLKNLHK